MYFKQNFRHTCGPFMPTFNLLSPTPALYSMGLIFSPYSAYQYRVCGNNQVEREEEAELKEQKQTTNWKRNVNKSKRRKDEREKKRSKKPKDATPGQRIQWQLLCKQLRMHGVRILGAAKTHGIYSPVKGRVESLHGVKPYLNSIKKKQRYQVSSWCSRTRPWEDIKVHACREAASMERRLPPRVFQSIPWPSCWVKSWPDCCWELFHLNIRLLWS